MLLVLDYENEIKRAWNTMVETTSNKLSSAIPCNDIIACFLEFVASESDEDDKEKVFEEVAESSFVEKGSCLINLNKVNTK